MPPHYAGYHTVPDGLAAALGDGARAVGPHRRALRAAAQDARRLRRAGALRTQQHRLRAGTRQLPHAGGVRHGRAAAAGAAWDEPLQLDRCERCSACLRACPSGAIRADRFLLQTDRCLTSVNEDEAPFPDWVDPAWHHCAVGCLRCQQSCPENAGVELRVAPAEVVRRGRDGGDPGGDAGARARRRDAREARALRPRLLAGAHRPQPARPPRRLTPGQPEPRAVAAPTAVELPRRSARRQRRTPVRG